MAMWSGKTYFFKEAPVLTLETHLEWPEISTLEISNSELWL